MKIGFGAYRISNRSAEHRQALELALELGLDFIDTSSNYTNGESETLIGEVLAGRDNKPFIMSKVGYIQGDNLKVIQQLNQIGLAKDGLVKVNDGLWHSIHPDFIRNQVELSLERLKLDSIDTYLLHNPEYYFYEKDATQEEYYKRISLAFSELEALVGEGKIKSYGVSSNNFVLGLDDPKVTNLEKVIECAKSVGSLQNFQWIQFPFNLVEIGALEKHYHGLSLVDVAKAAGIKTAINRPLNAFTENGLLRLATYEPFLEFCDEAEGKELFKACIQAIKDKLSSQDSDEDPMDIPLIKQFSEMYHSLPSEDAVQQVFMGSFFPLVARIWGGDLSPEDSEGFYELYDYSCNRARLLMTKRAQDFERQAIQAGLIGSEELPLQIKAVMKYFDYGFDRVLLGLKREQYINQFSEFLK